MNEPIPDGTRYLISKERLARLLGISVRSIDRATVIMNAAPDLAQQVKDGKISLHVAEGKLRARSEPPAPLG